jgi:hypothetical protein
VRLNLTALCTRHGGFLLSIFFAPSPIEINFVAAKIYTTTLEPNEWQYVDLDSASRVVYWGQEGCVGILICFVLFCFVLFCFVLFCFPPRYNQILQPLQPMWSHQIV